MNVTLMNMHHRLQRMVTYWTVLPLQVTGYQPLNKEVSSFLEGWGTDQSNNKTNMIFFSCSTFAEDAVAVVLSVFSTESSVKFVETEFYFYECSVHDS